MSMLTWLKAKTLVSGQKSGSARARRSFVQTNLPVISPRRSQRNAHRELLFTLVRESLIRGGVLSTSYEFKVLALDAKGDSFLVLIDLALSAESMAEAYLLEIERWIQTSAQSRYSMEVRAVYWRRKAEMGQRGTALKTAPVVDVQKHQEAPATQVAESTQSRKGWVDTQIQPEASKEMSSSRVWADTQVQPDTPEEALTQREWADTQIQAVGQEEIDAFRRAMKRTDLKKQQDLLDTEAMLPVPESHSDFSALSDTQYGKL